MTGTYQKEEIIRSLDSLDRHQSEKVLSFIRQLLRDDDRDLRNQYLKQKAMQEISVALRQSVKL